MRLLLIQIPLYTFPTKGRAQRSVNVTLQWSGLAPSTQSWHTKTFSGEWVASRRISPISNATTMGWVTQVKGSSVPSSRLSEPSLRLSCQLCPVRQVFKGHPGILSC
ncbi:hypothetical protein F4819DRAFT_364402 [Hypoxylon fuscum]|nr:hypothetical protein F4819DRAFT_364402 [Hypoxylon fuscum]